VRADTVGWRTE